MTRDELREQINLMEALQNVLDAILDVEGAEFEPGSRHEIDVAFSDRTKAGIAFAHSIPQKVVLAGLRAMQTMLEQTEQLTEQQK